MRFFAYLLLTHLGLLVAAQGQGASRISTPLSDQKKQIDQAAEKLRQAQSNGQLDQVKGVAKELLKKLPEGVTEAAKEALQSPEAKAKAAEAMKSAAQSFLPQAQEMLKGKGLPTGALMPAPVVEDQAPIIEGPKPSALAPLAVNPAKKAQPTVIIEADNSMFDLNEAIFIYTGNVRARHPDFYIECEELEVYMVKEEGKKVSRKDAPKGDTKKSNDPDLMKKAPDKNPIKKAIARGPMVTIEKRDEQGNVQQGKCRRLDYDQATGDIILSDYPQVQRGNVLHIATQADTTMVFDKTGKLRTNGRPRTVILSDEPSSASGTNPTITKPQSR
jgi:lipopolysaccharide export system protein LptA